ncbi:anti-sigma factor family protein [Falsiroseomonas sp.]|uniref:anti-sigma factor family protein n=1 Tax=Falsiroseomonas sp. TaxID=2870721 RepID=UPI00356278D7
MATDPQAPIGEDDLHAFVDGRLDPARAPAVERYLAGRPEEAARVRAFAAQRDALREALAFKAAEPIPARLRIESLHAARRRAMLARGRAAAAAALLLLTGAGLGWAARGTLQAQVAPAALPSAPATLHRLLAQAPLRLEVSARETDIAGWLRQHLGEEMPLPDLAGFGFALDSAWVLPAAAGASAMLRFVDTDGIAVSVWRRPTHDPVPRPLRCADEPGGLVTYSWSDGRQLHAVTAPLPRERLRPIAQAVERAMEAPSSAPVGAMAGLVRQPCRVGLG